MRESIEVGGPRGEDLRNAIGRQPRVVMSVRRALDGFIGRATDSFPARSEPDQKGTVMRDISKNYISGAWVNPSTDDTQDIVNPATGLVSGRLALSTAEDVDLAVSAHGWP
ncbi:hypothetical protein [Shinella sp. M27]|uniref:hypothetical protein n=1 Tax=Shinella sp. M27 TaxID=3368614 RepID=UPI003BA1358A